MTTSRLEAFSDGVLAIAITLLIIEIHPPEIGEGETLAHALWAQWNKNDRDLFQQHLANVLLAAMGETAVANVTTQMHSVNGTDLCRVHVRPSAFPVDAKVTVDNKGQFEKRRPSTSVLSMGPVRSPTLRSGRSTSPVDGQRQLDGRCATPAGSPIP